MKWLVRKLDVGDRNEPALKGQTTVSINVNNAEESKEPCIKIYIFLKFNLLDINFWVVGCILYIEIAGKKTDQDSDKHWIEKINNMSFLNELIERSGAVSNACQSWYLWGISLDFFFNWLKKGNQYKKYRPILGYSYFIRKGEFYLERRRKSRGWKISSIFSVSRSYLQKFFFRDNCTRIFIAFYHSPRFISLVKSESSTIVPLATVVVL